MGKKIDACSAVKFSIGKGGREKLADLVKWMDSVNWIGCTETEEKTSLPEFKNTTYTLICSERVDHPGGCDFYSFSIKERNGAINKEISMSVIPTCAAMNYKQDRITNFKMQFDQDPNILKFFSPLIKRIEKLGKLDKNDERSKACDNNNIFDVAGELIFL